MANIPSARCWELVTELKHPKTGKTLIEADKIDEILKEHTHEYCECFKTPERFYFYNDKLTVVKETPKESKGLSI